MWRAADQMRPWVFECSLSEPTTLQSWFKPLLEMKWGLMNLLAFAVGILAARLAQIRGAQQVILIDREEYRLKYALQKVLPLFKPDDALSIEIFLLSIQYCRINVIITLFRPSNCLFLPSCCSPQPKLTQAAAKSLSSRRLCCIVDVPIGLYILPRNITHERHEP